MPTNSFKGLEIKGNSIVAGLMVQRKQKNLATIPHSDYVEHVRAEMRQTLRVLFRREENRKEISSGPIEGV